MMNNGCIKYVIKHGLSTQLKENTLAPYEFGFNTDTSELMIGTDRGPIKLTEVVVGPDDGLYHKMPEGYIPLCIPNRLNGK